MRTKWLIPISLALLGIIAAGGGIVWAVISGAAIPGPDTPPEMLAQDRFHLRIASIFMRIGAILIMAASVAAIVALCRRKKQTRGFSVLPPPSNKTMPDPTSPHSTPHQ